MSRARVAALAVVTSCLLSLGACGVHRGGGRNQGSALWLAAGNRLEATAAVALEGHGVRELFVESARVTFEGGRPALEALALPSFPPRSLLTLVVVGEVATSFDPTAAGKTLAAALRQHRLDREGQGLVPRGLHFDLMVRRSALADYATLLSTVRRELDGVVTSATIAREWLATSEWTQLADAVDTPLIMAYGQRPHELEDPAAWDLTEVRRLLAQVEARKRDYLVGVSILGRLSRMDRKGQPLASTAEVASLRAVLLAPRLELQRGFSLAGANRQIFELEASTSTTLGDWALDRGDRVLVSRLASAHIGLLRADLAREPSTHRLGEVYVRLPLPSEGLGLVPGNLVNGFATEHPAPDLEVTVEQRARRGRQLELEVRLHNRNEEISDFSRLDHNWVELEVANGLWGELDAGGFARAWTVEHGPGDSVRVAARRPKILRLQHPLLEAGDEIASGPLLLAVDGKPQVTVRARFVLPDGELWELPSFLWDGTVPSSTPDDGATSR